MEPATVGIREFRARLADFLLKSDKPVAVTRHGATVGYFIPARAARADQHRASLREAAVKMDSMLKKARFGEKDLDEVAKEFQAWRRRRRK
jgi:antitoxin (DNA-binding transcriptional repressor) of toxin-antitoxin stability system